MAMYIYIYMAIYPATRNPGYPGQTLVVSWYGFALYRRHLLQILAKLYQRLWGSPRLWGIYPPPILSR